MKKMLLLSCCLILTSVWHVGCRTQREPVSRETTAMDTYLSVTIYDNDRDESFVNAMIDSAFLEVHRIDHLATDYSEVSEIGIINKLAGHDTAEVSGEIEGLVRESVRYSLLSGGSFDVTIGPLVRLWDFLAETPRVPSPDMIEEMLPLVDYRRISVRDGGIYLPDEGMRIDLGGIAKGYAVDKAIATLKRQGIGNVIIDLGGNLGVYWDGTFLLDSTRATVYVRHPRLPGEMFGHFSVGTCGIATSGDYQRYFIANGRRYHHVLDPATGEPANDVVSVTVVAGNATTADALSTAVFVLGSDKGMKLIESQREVEGIIITEAHGELLYQVSTGLEEGFVPEQLHD